MGMMKKTSVQLAIIVLVIFVLACIGIMQLNIGGNAEEIPVKDEEKKTGSFQIPVMKKDGKIHSMDLEDYTRNVILGEMPANFHQEALKAQAVASRTYTLQCIESANKHPMGAVCTDHRCCQAYREPDEYLHQGGTKEGIQKMQDAVDKTRGEVLYFQDDLICATYFASSGGYTEDAKAVWGQGYPYLQPVVSLGEEDCGYDQQVVMSAQELQERLNVKLTGDPKEWFGMITYTKGSGVCLMRIGGKLYTGVQLRNLLGLRSTIISVRAYENHLIFATKGYGHRVGMSQYGANAMAMNGENYKNILNHYYQGVTLEQYRNNND